MFEQQTIFQKEKEKQNYQNDFEQPSEKPSQKNKSTSHNRTHFYKRVFVFGIALMFLVSSILLFYKTQQPEKFANLLNHFKIIKQDSISSYDAFQRDKSINKDTGGEAGILMKSVTDRIFTCSGFTIEAESKNTSVDKEGNAGVSGNIVTKGDILPSSHNGHYFVTGITEENIIVDEVTINTPAKRVGIKKDDQIVAINGINLKNRDDLINYIQSKENLSVLLLVRRDGREMMLSIIPEKMYGERIGIGIKFTETNYRWSSETIYYGNDIYDKYVSSYSLGSNNEDFDNPSLSESLQWSNPMHYLNYLRFYKNPKIIKDTESQIKIAFDVDINYFKPVDMDYYGKDSGMYDEIIEIEGEITIDKHSQNPIQEKLKMIVDEQGSLKLYRETRNITLDFSNFDKGVVITPPDSKSVIIPW